MEQDLQIIYKSLEEEKIMHTKTKDSWLAEANHFEKTLKEKEYQIGNLQDELAALSGAKQQV